VCKYIILNRPRPTYSCDACWASLWLCFLLWWLAHAHVVVCFHSLFGAGLVGQTCGLALDLSACLEFKNCGLNLLRGGLGLLLWLSGTSPCSVISSIPLNHTRDLIRRFVLTMPWWLPWASSTTRFLSDFGMTMRWSLSTTPFLVTLSSHSSIVV
jgi:hypothetical protein